MGGWHGVRHAGFGVVASITESNLNELIDRQFTLGGPYYFPLPQVVSVGGATVSLGGIAMIAPPRLEVRAAGLRTHFGFYAQIRAAVGQRPATTWRIRLDAVVAAGVDIVPLNNDLVLRLQSSTVVFSPLSVTILQGPPPPQPVLNALQSQQLANAATNAVQGLPVIPLFTLAPAVYTHTEPRTYAKGGVSVFDWFTVRLVVSNVQLRWFDGAVTMAADFAEITNGDAAALADLTTSTVRPIYSQTLNDKAIEQQAPPFIMRDQAIGSPGQVVLVNLGLMSAIARQISDQTRGSTLDSKVTLTNIRIGYAQFDKPLRGREDGLHLEVGVRIADSMAVNLLTFLQNTATAHLYLQPYVQRYDGYKYEYQGTGRWRLAVVRLDLETTFLIDALLTLAVVLDLLAFMVVSPLALLNYRLFDATLGDLQSSIGDLLNKANAANMAGALQRKVNDQLIDVGFPGDVWYVSAGGEGVETGWRGGRFTSDYTPVVPSGGATITPTSAPAADRRPIVTSVRLSDQWAGLNRQALRCEWEVRRADTNEVVVRGSKPYNASGGNGVKIPHHSEALYLVDEFRIRCALTLASGGQSGEIWNGTTTLTITDILDRRNSFVEWGPKYVRFYNEGTGGAIWERLSRSRIHRTAAAARCRSVRLAAQMRTGDAFNENAHGRSRLPPLRYFDTLPWGSWDSLELHRREICEYCFYGGPDKTQPRPIPDWFETDPALLFEAAGVTPGKAGGFFEDHLKG